MRTAAQALMLCAAELFVCRALRAQSKRDPEALQIVVQGEHRAQEPIETAVAASEAREFAGSESDPVKVIEDLPGVARPAFGAGQLIVWGSAATDTRIEVDGVEIPQIFHGNMLRSTLPSELVKRVSLVPGAYGVESGRALGGLVRVETSDLPATGVHAAANVDVLDASALLGAALNPSLRVAAAFRYAWIDRVFHALTARDVGDAFAIPRYADHQVKAQLALRERESLDLVLLGSSDFLRRNVPDPDPSHARAATTSNSFERAYLRYRRVLPDGRELEIVPWVGLESTRNDQVFGTRAAALHEDARVYGLRAVQRSHLGAEVSLSLGIDIEGRSSQLFRQGSLGIPAREGDISVFGEAPGADTNSDTWQTSIVDIAPYAALDLELGALELLPGLRVDGYAIDVSRATPRVGQTPALGASRLDGEVEPRVSARLRVAPALALIAAAGVYSQPPAASDLSAVFGTPELGPERAYHGALGEKLALTSSLSLEMTAFYKWMDHLALRDPSPTPRLARALLDDGVGRSYGVEWRLRQAAWYGFLGFVSYTLSRSERRAGGATGFRLFDDDEPEVLSLVANQTLGGWTVGVRFRYARGLPRTPVLGALYDVQGDAFQPIFGAQNSIRLPDFWQLDARLERRFLLARALRLTLYAEVLNVTDHANGEEYAYSADYRQRALIKGVPIVPIVGAHVEL